MELNNLIYKYLDKETNSDEEKKLFGALSYDDELREEFNCALLIETNLKNTSIFYPEQKTVNTLFANLGYTIPILTPAPKISSGVLQSTILKYIISSVIGAIICYMAVTLLPKKDLPINDNSNITSINQSQAPLISNIENEQSNITAPKNKIQYC